MAILEIVKYPDPLLYEASEEITEITDEIRDLVNDMVETMYATEGVGVAAVQVGVLKRLFVIDPTFAGGTKEDPAFVFINPVIIDGEGEMKGEEGCLSLPGVFITIKRFAKTTVSARNLDWEEFEMTGEGILSRAFQHEMEHLDGQLIIDGLGGLRKKIALRKLRS
ncbi:peptide deformylase [Myxococcota bacterium]|nr:peptide deformylase [Myxococcota bacterium]